MGSGLISMDIDSPSKLETPSSNNLRAGDGVGDDSGDCNGDINLRNLLSAEFRRFLKCRI